jgi:S1-C subfamily serine protease
VNSLAAIHLRQARAFLRAGEAQRAVELLEKARALARDDAQMLQDILGQLAEAYEKAGATEKAKRCGEQLGHLAGRDADNGTQFDGGKAYSTKRKQSVWRETIAGVAAVLLIGCAIFGAWEKWHPPVVVPVAAATQAVTTLPTLSNTLVSSPVPTTQTIPITVHMMDKQLRQCVGMLVLVGHYEGIANGVPLKVDIPLDSGSAFVVKRSGILLTTKHLAHEAQENDFPSTLQVLKLPTVTLRDIGYVLCFGSNRDDWSGAKLLYESDKFDLAVIQTDRHFASALDCSGRNAVQGEPVYAWGYPVVLNNIFHNPHADRHGLQLMLQELQEKHSINLLSGFSIECFSAVDTVGKISVAGRNIDGAECVQFDAKMSAGTIGGPLVDASRRVVAIVQSAGKDAMAGYNYGILTDQLQDEIAPYMRGD